MEDADVKLKVFDLLMEQPTLSMADDQHFVDLIFHKFGRIATTTQVATAREDIKKIDSKADIEAIPRPEAWELGKDPRE